MITRLCATFPIAAFDKTRAILITCMTLYTAPQKNFRKTRRQSDTHLRKVEEAITAPGIRMLSSQPNSSCRPPGPSRLKKADSPCQACPSLQRELPVQLNLITKWLSSQCATVSRVALEQLRSVRDATRVCTQLATSVRLRRGYSSLNYFLRSVANTNTISQDPSFGGRDVHQARFVRKVHIEVRRGWQNHAKVRCKETARLLALTKFRVL
jgi:hypothetical protein